MRYNSRYARKPVEPQRWKWQLRALLAVSLIWLAPTLACGSFAPAPRPRRPLPADRRERHRAADGATSGGPVGRHPAPGPFSTDTPTPEPTATFTPTPIPGTALGGRPAGARRGARMASTCATEPSSGGQLAAAAAVTHQRVTVCRRPGRRRRLSLVEGGRRRRQRRLGGGKRRRNRVAQPAHGRSAAGRSCPARRRPRAGDDVDRRPALRARDARHRCRTW